MSPRERQVPIVAELGRPETAEETAFRKAENSANHRRRQTVNNLIYSLLATVGLVVIMILVVPRGDKPLLPDVDFRAAAAEAQSAFTVPLASPDVPDGWKANLAEVRTSPQDVQSWYIGFITPQPEQQFAAISEGIGANDEWLHDQLPKLDPTGSLALDGAEWTVYDHRDHPDTAGNAPYALVTPVDGTTLVVYGTASVDEVQQLATAALDSMNGSN